MAAALTTGKNFCCGEDGTKRSDSISDDPMIQDTLQLTVYGVRAPLFLSLLIARPKKSGVRMIKALAVATAASHSTCADYCRRVSEPLSTVQLRSTGQFTTLKSENNPPSLPATELNMHRSDRDIEEFALKRNGRTIIPLSLDPEQRSGGGIKCNAPML